jgi:hypothetical protein
MTLYISTNNCNPQQYNTNTQTSDAKEKSEDTKGVKRRTGNAIAKKKKDKQRPTQKKRKKDRAARPQQKPGVKSDVQDHTIRSNVN